MVVGYAAGPFFLPDPRLLYDVMRCKHGISVLLHGQFMPLQTMLSVNVPLLCFIPFLQQTASAKSTNPFL